MNDRPTRALISTQALLNNLRLIRRQIGPTCRVIAVVKADCYGHGIEICVPELRVAGIEIFAVATVEEAEQLRQLGVRERIVVMTPPLEGQYQEFARLSLEAFVSNHRNVEALGEVWRAAGGTGRIHLFVDTGMARNGVEPDGVIPLREAIVGTDGLELVGVSSHFATSEEIDNSFALEQSNLFSELVRELERRGDIFDVIHIANSGGIFNLPDSHHTAVRPGISLYGYHPAPELQDSSGLVPVMSLCTVIANITRIPAGHPVGYGRTYYTESDTLIATLPIGYADGLPRILSNRIDALIQGERRRVVGTISMDEVTLDLGAESSARVGDEVFLIGSQGKEKIDAWELARKGATIPYEITTNISVRVPRADQKNQQGQ